MKRFAPLMTFALGTLLPAAMTLACPSCKDSIPTSDAQEAANLPGGFNMSVYYMLFGLLVTLGLCIGVIAKGIRSTNVQIAKQ